MPDRSDQPPRGLSDVALSRWITAAILTVAAAAAVGSAIHIYADAQRYGQPQPIPWLMPAAIDGQVTAASVWLMRAARLELPGRHVFAQLVLAVGVLETLGANFQYGIGHGWMGAAWSLVPGVGFVSCAELAIVMGRKRAAAETDQARRDARRARRAAASEPDRASGPADQPDRTTVPARPLAPVPAVYAAYAQSRADGSRGLSQRDLAAQCGVSVRAARTAIAAYRSAAAAGQPVTLPAAGR